MSVRTFSDTADTSHCNFEFLLLFFCIFMNTNLLAKFRQIFDKQGHELLSKIII